MLIGLNDFKFCRRIGIYNLPTVNFCLFFFSVMDKCSIFADKFKWKYMMSMKIKTVLMTGLMVLGPVNLSAQKQWTLQDCIDYAMDNNITLQKSKLQKQSATEDLKGAKAALLPTLSASTNQSLGYQPWKDAGIATVTNGTVNTKIDKTSYNGSYSLSGQWTVLILRFPFHTVHCPLSE